MFNEHTVLGSFRQVGATGCCAQAVPDTTEPSDISEGWSFHVSSARAESRGLAVRRRCLAAPGWRHIAPDTIRRNVSLSILASSTMFVVGDGLPEGCSCRSAVPFPTHAQTNRQLASFTMPTRSKLYGCRPSILVHVRSGSNLEHVPFGTGLQDTG